MRASDRSQDYKKEGVIWSWQDRNRESKPWTRRFFYFYSKPDEPRKSSLYIREPKAVDDVRRNTFVNDGNNFPKNAVLSQTTNDRRIPKILQHRSSDDHQAWVDTIRRKPLFVWNKFISYLILS